MAKIKSIYDNIKNPNIKLFCVYVKQVNFNELYLEAENEDQAREYADKLLMNNTASVKLGESGEDIDSVEEIKGVHFKDSQFRAYAKENAEYLKEIEAQGEDKAIPTLCIYEHDHDKGECVYHD